MSLWYAQSGPRSNDTGKFRSRTRVGTEKSSGGEHRGWSYHFVSHQTGTSVKRTSYSVSITDPYGNRVEYLRGFSSVDQAVIAARDWIDALLRKMMPTATAAEIGTIPTVPETPLPKNSVPQEK